MMRQYIGARYVTKVYENSLDQSSAEWEAGVTYEPLTMVTYNNSSYLSKKDVPGSVGDPANNPAYWVVTGAYNGQILGLQNQIDKMRVFVTPEMYGAVGDGVTDDTQAIKDAIASGLVVWLSATYYCAGDIDIDTQVSGQDGKIVNGRFIVKAGTTIENITIDTHDIDYLLAADNADDVTLSNDKVTGAHGLRIMNTTNDNIQVIANNIDVTKYCVLTNDAHMKNLRIIGNKLKSTGDCVELNTPNVNDAGYNAIVGNTMYNGDTYTPGTGFSVGIANGRQTVVVGNTSEKSMREGVHIEDGSEDIVIVGNVFDQCALRGVNAACDANGDGIIVTGNVFNGSNNSSGSNTMGAAQIYTGNTAGLPYIITNNKFSNFEYGYYNTGDYPTIGDNNVFVDCPYATVGGQEVLGHVILKGSSKIVATDGARIERVTFLDDVADIGSMIAVPSHIRIEELDFRHHFNLSPAATAFDALPSFMYADGVLDITAKSGNYYAILRIKSDGTVIYAHSYGTIVLQVNVTANNIKIDCHSSSMTSDCRLAVHFKGSVLL